MIEQLHATTCGFINALSVRTLLARFSATSSRPRGKLRTWIIDRHRIYRTLARVNGYHWDETDLEVDGESNDSEGEECTDV